ncbi:hypothetical protein TNCV_784971 [Trichonephila clavipes]|nr:hypothetical protein TNCV_784971 [Trichonephila clavipes]
MSGPSLKLKQSMRAKAYRAHPSIRDHWVLRCMSRCPYQGASLKRDRQGLSPQASRGRVHTAKGGVHELGKSLSSGTPLKSEEDGSGIMWAVRTLLTRDRKRQKKEPSEPEMNNDRALDMREMTEVPRPSDNDRPEKHLLEREVSNELGIYELIVV